MRKTLLRSLCASFPLTLLLATSSLPGPGSPGQAAQGEPTRTKVRLDFYGDPLPARALLRLGTVRLRHGAPIVDLAFSPTGKTLASCDTEGRISLWDVATGKELHRLTGHKGMVRALAFFPDGKLLASGGEDKNIIFWNVKTGQEVRRFEGHPGNRLVPGSPATRVNSLAVSSKGILASSGDNDVALWDIQGKKVGSFAEDELTRLLANHPAGFYGLAFSPDGKWLSFGDNLGTVWLWDVVKQKVTELHGHDKEVTVYHTAFSPDGKYLASGVRDGLILWNLVKREKLQHWKETVGSRICFSSDSKTVAAGITNKKLTLWHVATGKPAKVLPLYGGRALAFSPDQRLLATVGIDSTVIRLWDVVSDKELLGCPPTDLGRNLSRQGGPLVLGDFVHIWAYDRLSGKLLYTLTSEVDDCFSSYGVSPDGKTLLAVGVCYPLSEKELLIVPPVDASLYWYEARTGKKIRTLSIRQLESERFLFPPDFQYLVAWGYFTTQVYDLTTGKKCYHHPKEAQQVAFAPQGKYLAFTTGTRLHVVDTRRWQECWQADGQEGLVFCSFSPDGKYLAASDAQTIRWWDVATGKQMPTTLKAPAPLSQLTFSPDGQSLLVTPMAASPTGKFLPDPLLPRNTTPRLFDLATGREMRRFTFRLDFLEGVQFALDGRTLYTWGVDKEIHLWEVATGAERLRLRGHQAPVVGVSQFAADRTLLTTSFDRIGLLWDLTGWRTDRAAYPERLTRPKLEQLWTDLGSADAQQAYLAGWRLAAAPKDTLAFLQEQLRPVPGEEGQQLRHWIADLDSKSFKTRQQAQKGLQKRNRHGELALREALKKPLSLEHRLTLELLLEKLADQVGDAEFLRALRVPELLENIGTTEAIALLRRLADGAPEAWLSQESRLALGRLQAKRPL